MYRPLISIRYVCFRFTYQRYPCTIHTVHCTQLFDQKLHTVHFYSAHLFYLTVANFFFLNALVMIEIKGVKLKFLFLTWSRICNLNSGLAPGKSCGSLRLQFRFRNTELQTSCFPHFAFISHFLMFLFPFIYLFFVVFLSHFPSSTFSP